MPLDLAHRRETRARPDSAAGSPGTVLQWLLSAWCWAVLVGVTLAQYGRGLLVAPFTGPRIWGPVLQAWARGLLALGGIDLQVEAPPRIDPPVVFVANHQSAFDIAVMAALVPPPVVFVARVDLFRVPIVGGVLRRGGHIAVEREERADRMQVVGRILERLEAGTSVVVFAEGTRSASGAVHRLRAGAFLAARQAGRPLVPVALAGTRHVVAKGRRLLRPSRMAAAFLPPVEVTEEVASPRGRAALQRRLAETVRRLEPGTGPRWGSGA
ncbi:MAG: lysophospholipid acyltransferase family protein [Thermoanaerobaculia bacterium]